MEETNMAGVRDQQRSRLYAAERECHHGPQEHLRSVQQMQNFIDRVCTQRWFQSRWGNDVKIEVRGGQGHRRAVCYGDVLHIPLWGREELVLLHELAHSLVTYRRGLTGFSILGVDYQTGAVAGHGPEYAGVFLFLVRQVLGAEEALKLKAAFKKHRVRSNTKLVPPAKTHRVVTQTQRRAALVRAQQAPLQAHEISRAVDVLRRAAKQGAFGGSGRKPRAHALATARALETWTGC
jgi:putative metallohydrolase (TIGR04338 family)